MELRLVSRRLQNGHGMCVGDMTKKISTEEMHLWICPRMVLHHSRFHVDLLKHGLGFHSLSLLPQILVHVRMCLHILAVHLGTLELYSAVHVSAFLLQLLFHVLMHLLEQFLQLLMLLLQRLILGRSFFQHIPVHLLALRLHLHSSSVAPCRRSCWTPLPPLRRGGGGNGDGVLSAAGYGVHKVHGVELGTSPRLRLLAPP